MKLRARLTMTSIINGNILTFKIAAYFFSTLVQHRGMTSFSVCRVGDTSLEDVSNLKAPTKLLSQSFAHFSTSEVH